MLMIFLLLISLAQSTLLLQATNKAQPEPADVLRSLLKAVEHVESVEYEVRSEHSTTDGKKYKARTRILATRSPFQFSARLQAEDAPFKQMAVSDGKVTRASTRGETSEAPFVFSSQGRQVVLNDANEDVAATWRLLLDQLHIKKAIESGSILFINQDEIEGDLCNIVLYSRPLTGEAGSTTEYYWVSAKTGLPRAVQRWTLQRGHTRFGPQFIISNINLNPGIPAETFSYRPAPSDSFKGPELKPSPQPPAKSLIGAELADLEVMDLQPKPVKLSRFRGQPTLINFWAPWCGPCIEEFPTLEKIQKSYKGKLQVVAIAVQDTRLNVLEFIKKNPRYRFIFLSDPEISDRESRLNLYFGIKEIPVSVFVDGQGRVVDHWSGFSGEEGLVKRIQKLMGQ
jgi:thiol-disulfide isomerase/thioredoxin/outer membrane lipoprotein-sorting protein